MAGAARGLTDLRRGGVLPLGQLRQSVTARPGIFIALCIALFIVPFIARVSA